MSEASYEDMLYLPHPTSKVHPPMARRQRAAQFGAFAALGGHKEAVQETARVTEARALLSEDMCEWLDWRLQWLEHHLVQRPLVTLAYFVADGKKDGGRYEAVTGRVRRIDRRQRKIFFESGATVPLMDVVVIEGTCFEDGGA